jgi:hypothetical protein
VPSELRSKLFEERVVGGGVGSAFSDCRLNQSNKASIAPVFGGFSSSRSIRGFGQGTTTGAGSGRLGEHAAQLSANASTVSVNRVELFAVVMDHSSISSDGRLRRRQLSLKGDAGGSFGLGLLLPALGL